MAFMFREQLQHTLSKELQNGLTHHYNVTTKGANSLVNIWDKIQVQVSTKASTYYITFRRTHLFYNPPNIFHFWVRKMLHYCIS